MSFVNFIVSGQSAVIKLVTAGAAVLSFVQLTSTSDKPIIKKGKIKVTFFIEIEMLKNGRNYFCFIIKGLKVNQDKTGKNGIGARIK